MENRENRSSSNRLTGFTIVELLIVVVVIAILAAITIVSYNGISKRAAESTIKSALSTAQKKVGTYMIDNNETYPTYIAEAGIKDGNGTTYQYTGNNTTSPAGYCVTATYTDSVVFHAAQTFTPFGSSASPITTATPESGPCPDHIAKGTTITNYVPNSSAGTGIIGYSGPNSTAIAHDTAVGYSGASSVRVTMPLSAASLVGVMFYNMTDVSAVLTPGMTYTASAWVRVPSSTNANVRMAIQGSGKAQLGNLPQRISSEKNKWVRIYDTFVANSTGSIQFYVLNDNATTAADMQFWADAFMINKTNQPAVFANGNTDGWTWDGTNFLSASTGPAL